MRASTDMLIYLGDVFQPLFCDVVGCAAVRFRRAEYHARRGFKRSDWYTVYLRRPVPGELLLTAESEFNAVLVVQEHHSGLHFRQGVRIVRVEQDALYMSGWDPWDSAPPSVGTDVELDGPWRFTQLELKGWCEAKHRRLPVGRLKNFSREAATPEGRVRVMQRLLTHPSFSWGYELQPFLVPPQPRRARDSRGRSQ